MHKSLLQCAPFSTSIYIHIAHFFLVDGKRRTFFGVCQLQCVNFYDSKWIDCFPDMYVSVNKNTFTYLYLSCRAVDTGWLRLVGSFKLSVSVAEYCLLYRALLQQRLILWKSLLIVATPYASVPRVYLDLHVSFAEYRLLYRALLQKRPILLSHPIWVCTSCLPWRMHSHMSHTCMSGTPVIVSDQFILLCITRWMFVLFVWIASMN